MYYTNHITIITLLSLFFSGITSCKKYLDEKPLQNLYIPTTLNDLQTLLDNHNSLNQQNSPPLLELVSDNYYLTATHWQSLSSAESKLNYIWDKDAVYNDSWNAPYQMPVYYSNVVLDFLPSIKNEAGEEDYKSAIYGAALFYRAYAFYELAQLYCRPYSNTASTDPGIVLKLTSDINEKSVRSTVQQTYDQITGDLETAAAILPNTSSFPTQPSKAAAYGALARTYLAMRDYVNAGKYADLCLQIRNVLMDYNTTSNPFQRFNPEVIYFNTQPLVTILSNTRAKIDSNLYHSYSANDLRKTKFFQANTGVNAGTYGFRGSYVQSPVYLVFSGLATDEMYLIRAEASARVMLKDSALADLNRLMMKRWSNNGTWVPYTATDATDALEKILTERRKELIFRGLRWTDIRRLNLEGANITLTRKIDDVSYTLPPNDLRSIMLIPWDVINRSGIEQNKR